MNLSKIIDSSVIGHARDWIKLALFNFISSIINKKTTLHQQSNIRLHTIDIYVDTDMVACFQAVGWRYLGLGI